MKIAKKSWLMLATLTGSTDTVDCMILTREPLNEFEREMLVNSGCKILSGATSRAVWVRFRGCDANLVVNLGFIEQIEVYGASG